MPRFVVLRHEMPEGAERGTHFDLMLEADGVLWTWALSELPQIGRSVEAERLADHRRMYLEYEGEVSGGRGCVRPAIRGQFELLEQLPNRIQARIEGGQLAGVLTISREPGAQRWCVSLSPA